MSLEARIAKIADSGAQIGQQAQTSDIKSTGTPQLMEIVSGRHLNSLRRDLYPAFTIQKIWSDQLVPRLHSMEQGRAAAKEEHKRRSLPAKIGCAIGGLVGFAFIGIFSPMLAMGAYTLITRSTRKALESHGTRAKHLLVAAACETLGFTYKPTQTVPKPKNIFSDTFEKFAHGFSLNRSATDLENACPTPAMGVISQYGLYGQIDKARFDDMVCGERSGVEFSMVEAHLQRYEGSGKSRRLVTKFQGILLHFEYPRNFLGTTIVSKAGSGTRLARKNALNRVDIVASEFRNLFDVCSNDQTEARYLLSPDRLLRLIALSNYFSHRQIQAVFTQGHMTLALSTPDMFEVGDAWNGLIDQSRFADCLHELGLICDVIDGYLTREWSAGKV